MHPCISSENMCRPFIFPLNSVFSEVFYTIFSFQSRASFTVLDSPREVTQDALLPVRACFSSFGFSESLTEIYAKLFGGLGNPTRRMRLLPGALFAGALVAALMMLLMASTDVLQRC